MGLFQHCVRRLIILLPPDEFLHSSPEAPRTTQARETSASEIRNYYQGICESTRFFYMPQSWNMGQILSFPLRRKACWGLFGHPKNPTASDGFEPANQRPAFKQLDHRSRYPVCYCISFRATLVKFICHISLGQPPRPHVIMVCVGSCKLDAIIHRHLKSIHKINLNQFTFPGL